MSIQAQPVQRPSWHAIANTVKGVDEGKIRDCKEDIDTLLVFVCDIKSSRFNV